MKFLFLAAAAILACAIASADEDKGKILGSPGAPVRIEVYSDFACPACKKFHDETIPMLVRDYVTRGKVCIISHEYPLNIPAHRFSREAANYATAAARLGIYQPVADALFKAQAQWSITGQVWETVASVLSPDQQKRVQALAKDPSVQAEVQRDVDAGNRDKVASTPTVLVQHGMQRFPIPVPVNYPFLRQLLDGYTK